MHNSNFLLNKILIYIDYINMQKKISIYLKKTMMRSL